MRWSTKLCGVLLATRAAIAAAEPPGYYVYADVLDVEPLVRGRTVTEPRQQCSRVTDGSSRYPRYRHRYYDDDPQYARNSHGNPVASLFGGVIGGLIGSQFGGGNGRKAFTVAGAMIGASIATQASRSSDRHSGRYPTLRCRTIMESREIEEIAGYRVRYVYQGREFVKQVHSDPGDHIRVHVQVTPVVTEPVW